MIARGRTLALVGAFVLIALIAAPAGARTATPNSGSSDPSDDFLTNCEPSSAPRSGALPMDMVGARFLGEQNGALRFQIATRDDIAGYLARNPPSAAFEIEILERPGGRIFKVGHELHAGRTQDYVKVDDKPFTGSATVSLDQGLVSIVVTGLPPMGDARWSATTFNEPDPKTFLCDRLQDGANGIALPPTQGAAGAVSTTSNTTAKPAADDKSASDKTEKKKKSDDGSSLAIWGALFAGIMFFVFFGLAFRQQMRKRHHEGSGSHGAPPTPPEDENDFGE